MFLNGRICHRKKRQEMNWADMTDNGGHKKKEGWIEQYRKERRHLGDGTEYWVINPEVTYTVPTNDDFFKEMGILGKMGKYETEDAKSILPKWYKRREKEEFNKLKRAYIAGFKKAMYLEVEDLAKTHSEDWKLWRKIKKFFDEEYIK